MLQKSLKIKGLQKFGAIHLHVGEMMLGLLDAKLLQLGYLPDKYE